VSALIPAKGIQVHSVFFEQDSIVIGYVELPTDVRVGGQVVIQKQARLAISHPDYADDAVLLHDRVVKVLRNALEDFNSSEPFDPSLENEDDEDTGMGM
jgi:hypothetical protein